MKAIVEKRVLYMCSRCRTKYSSEKEALRCEKRVPEKRAFKIGDRVKNILEPRFCSTKGKEYSFSGTVVKVLGSYPSDYEYEVKWLGAKKERVRGHVFQYQVAFRCPRCGEKREERYYAPELKLIRR